jgi:hypothetical protein
MDNDEPPLFTMKQSKKQSEQLIKAGISRKTHQKELGIRTTVVRSYSEQKTKDEANRRTNERIDADISKRFAIK